MRNYIFLREIDEQESLDMSFAVQKSITALPFSLANPVKMYFQEVKNGNYDKAMEYSLEFLEMSVQWVSIFLLRSLISHQDRTHEGTRVVKNVISKIDKKRPLSFGDWVNDIFCPLALVSAYEFQDQALASSIKNNLFKRKRCILLGDKGEPSVVNIRNEYKGHGTTLSQNLYRNVVYTLEPYVVVMLNAIMPLCDAEFLSAVEIDGKIYYNNHKGATINDQKEGDGSLKPSHYYVRFNGQKRDVILDLFPLLYSSPKGYVYVFQTLGEDKITYVSSNFDAERVHNDTFNEEFDAVLQQVDPTFDISHEKNWNELQFAMAEESKHYLARLYDEKKYNRELFVDRKSLSSLLENFYESDKSLLPLLGEAGQGKTNQLCYWAEQHIKQQDGILVFNSSDFAVMTLDDRIRMLLGYSPRKDIRKIIDKIHEQAVTNNHKVYIFFDAINECLSYSGNAIDAGPIALYEAIGMLFMQSNYTQFKILFTCRNYTWKTLFANIAERDNDRFYIDDKGISIVRGFNVEELEQAYVVYQDLFQMKTIFANLNRSVCVRLKDPLVLKLTSVNYLNEELPDGVECYASIALFKKMFEDVRASYGGNKQCEIMLSIGRYFLDSYERGEAIDSIPEKMLYDACEDIESPLHKLSTLIFTQDGKSVAYGELVNKPERPIMRLADVAGCESKCLQFIYERFLEYIMACIFIERHRVSLPSNTAIKPEVYAKSICKADANVVYMGVLRNALIMDLMHTEDYTTILHIVRDYSDNYEMTSLVTDVCHILIRENYETQMFALLEQMLDAKIEGGDQIINELNALTKAIDNNKADATIISRHKVLRAQLEPIIRLRQMALVNTFNGLLLTDYFNESLYKRQPLELVWRLVCDPIKEVGNGACLYAYYLTNRHYTLENSPIRENLAEIIVRRMYAAIKSHNLFLNVIARRLRTRMVTFLETAVRIHTLLIIDELLLRKEQGHVRVTQMLADIRDIMRYVSGNWMLVRLFMPFLQIIMRTQITFQKIYVNNAIEYQCFWDEGVIPKEASDGVWSREAMRKLLPLMCYSIANEQQCKSIENEFRKNYPTLCSCYEYGDSFSYFVVERLLVIMGAKRWENVQELYSKYLFSICRQSQWFDYSQMSLLYSLFQIGLDNKYNPEILEIYTREAEDWTLRCRGLFRARNSHKANTLGLYKRNVMDWYSALYCAYSGDNVPLPGHKRCVPLFYKLIDDAIDSCDKELLFHLLENISELITDFGLIRTGLALLYHTLSRIDDQEKLTAIDNVVVNRDGIYRSDLVSVVGNILSTAKNYYPDATDLFVRRDIVGLGFPGVSKYREDILNYNPSGETLSDLITHKFGKFVIWSLQNEPTVNRFAQRAVENALEAKSCFEWYDKTVRLAFKELFRLNI